MQRIVLIIIVVSLVLNASAQQVGKKLYNTDNTMYSKNSFFLAPGITYQLGGAQTNINRNFGDTSYAATLNPNGTIGLYIAGGWDRRISKRMITSFDISAAYKQLKGNEKLSGELSDTTGAFIANTSGTRSFSDNYISLSVNANKLISFGKIGIQNSLGANIDYSLSSSTSSDVSSELGLTNTTPKNIVGQLHYRLGVFIPLRKSWTLAPSIETPILNVYEFENGKSTLPHFNSRYRAFIISLRIIFNPEGDDCPPVYAPSGMGGKNDGFGQ